MTDWETPCDKAELLAELPPVWPEPLEDRIREQLAAGRQRLVVLDDDPTGTQTVHGLPVLTEWSVESLAEELAQSPVFYVLTNSRSLTTERAVALAQEQGANLKAAAEQVGRPIAVASRSDSTLRGHYPAEVDALADALGGGFDATVLIPFFPEGGRLTINDVHYVAQGEQLVPAAQTEFAQDRSFGFTQSHLPHYVAEKTGGRVVPEDVVCITLDDLRTGGPDAVTAKLGEVPTGGVVAVNSVDYRDQEVFVSGLLAAEAAGKRFMYRTAAGFVRVRGGIAQRPVLSGAEMTGGAPTDAGGLLVVGSYVAKSTEQLQQALATPGVTGVELPVGELLTGDILATIQRTTREVNDLLAAGKDAALYTSRDLEAGESQAENLAIGRAVSEALCSVVRGLEQQPRFLIAKGGITSSDIATQGLGVRRAWVLGQIQPGVPVWRLGEESAFPGMAYVVFPGNVGDPDAVARAITQLREG